MLMRESKVIHLSYKCVIHLSYKCVILLVDDEIVPSLKLIAENSVFNRFRAFIKYFLFQKSQLKRVNFLPILR